MSSPLSSPVQITNYVEVSNYHESAIGIVVIPGLQCPNYSKAAPMICSANELWIAIKKTIIIIIDIH